jgi:hypothetical protein
MRFATVTGLLAALSLGACVIIDTDDDGIAGFDDDRGYGTIRAASVGPDRVTARVASNGCTSKDTIRPDIRKTGDNQFTLGLKRVREDYCKALLPDGVELTWAFEELGIPDGAQVILLNRISR